MFLHVSLVRKYGVLRWNIPLCYPVIPVLQKVTYACLGVANATSPVNNYNHFYLVETDLAPALLYH